MRTLAVPWVFLLRLEWEVEEALGELERGLDPLDGDRVVHNGAVQHSDEQKGGKRESGRRTHKKPTLDAASKSSFLMASRRLAKSLNEMRGMFTSDMAGWGWRKTVSGGERKTSCLSRRAGLGQR